MIVWILCLARKRGIDQRNISLGSRAEQRVHGLLPTHSEGDQDGSRSPQPKTTGRALASQRGLPRTLALYELAYQLTQGLRSGPMGDLGLGHELSTQLWLQLQGENCFFGPGVLPDTFPTLNRQKKSQPDEGWDFCDWWRRGESNPRGLLEFTRRLTPPAQILPYEWASALAAKTIFDPAIGSICGIHLP